MVDDDAHAASLFLQERLVRVARAGRRQADPKEATRSVTLCAMAMSGYERAVAVLHENEDQADFVAARSRPT